MFSVLFGGGGAHIIVDSHHKVMSEIEKHGENKSSVRESTQISLRAFVSPTTFRALVNSDDLEIGSL